MKKNILFCFLFIMMASSVAQARQILDMGRPGMYPSLLIPQEDVTASNIFLDRKNTPPFDHTIPLAENSLDPVSEELLSSDTEESCNFINPGNSGIRV